MIVTKFDDSDFLKTLMNVAEYSLGFVDGVQAGKPKLLKNIGKNVKHILEGFIDSNAKINPQSLHHVYEWYQTGSPSARLFDISYVVKGDGLTFNHTFSQSQSIKNGSTVPFYDKANIMENSIPVTITPVNSEVLAFDDGSGDTVFTRKPVTVNHPGGEAVAGSFQNTINMFFNQYLSQSFFDIVGIKLYLNDISLFAKNLNKNSNRSTGISTGTKWISGTGELL